MMAKNTFRNKTKSLWGDTVCGMCDTYVDVNICNTLNPQLGGGGCHKATLWEDEKNFLASQDGSTTSAAIPHTIQNATFAESYIWLSLQQQQNINTFFFSFFQPPADYKTKTGGIVVFLSVTLIFNGPQGFHCLTTQCSNSNMTVAQIGGSKTTIITLLANKGCHFFNPHPFCVCCLFGDLFDILSHNLCKNTDETINTTLMLKF